MSARQAYLSGGPPWGFRWTGGADLGAPIRIIRVRLFNIIFTIYVFHLPSLSIQKVISEHIVPIVFYIIPLIPEANLPKLKIFGSMQG